MGWIQEANKSIEKRGTKGVCTGDKFGGPTCPEGSKRYNLAKTFRKMAKKRKNKKQCGGGFQCGGSFALGPNKVL